jgi:hypothetical protein
MTLEERLAANARWILVGLVAFSIAFRVAYVAQIDGGPCSQWHRWEDGDPNFFDQWGRRIAAGDWIGDGSFHPMHGWHKRVAREYFIRQPLEEIEIRKSGRDPATVVWDRWYGGPLFHQEPLYPYLVGATYKVFGPDPRWVYAWQMILGVLSNVLIWGLARRHFGERAGLVAAAMASLCGPIAFYEMTLVRTTLTVFTTLGLCVLFERAFERNTWRAWAVAGVGLGLALLLQTTFALFGLAALGILAWRSRDRTALRAAGVVAAAAMACLVPVVARNAVVGAPLFGLSSVGTVTFVAANWPDSDPTRGWAVDDRMMARLLAETGGRFGSAMRNTLDRHSPVTFAELMGRKLKMLFHDYELPNNKNFLYYREHAPVLRIGFVGFGLILSLALFGLHAAWKRETRPWLLFATILTAAAPMLIFYVLARFRAPLTAALIPFAALGAVTLADWIRERRWKPAAIAGGLVLVTAIILFRPLPGHMRPIRSADYRVAFRTFGAPKERAAVESSDWSAAAAILATTLEDEPDEVRGLKGEPLPEGGFEIRQITDFFRAVHSRRGDYLDRLGRTEDSRRELERAETLRRSLGGVPTAPWKP